MKANYLLGPKPRDIFLKMPKTEGNSVGKPKTKKKIAKPKKNIGEIFPWEGQQEKEFFAKAQNKRKFSHKSPY